MDLKDLSETLGIKYFSDRKRLIDAQKKLRVSASGAGAATGAGGGKRTDVRNLQASWEQVEEWRRRKPSVKSQPTFNFGIKAKVFHVSKMCFSRQNNIQPEKGQLPIKVTATPTLSSVKLACWNAFNNNNDASLPEDIDVFITDNTKKKFISRVREDEELLKISSIGILWKEKHDTRPKSKQQHLSDFSKVKQTQMEEIDLADSDDDKELLKSCFDSQTGGGDAHVSKGSSSTASKDKYLRKSSTHSSSASTRPSETLDKLSRKETHSVQGGASDRKQCCNCSCSADKHSSIPSFPGPLPYNLWSVPCLPPQAYYQAPPAHVQSAAAAQYYKHMRPFAVPEPHAKVYKSTPPKIWNALAFSDVPKYEPWEPSVNKKSHGHEQSDHVAVDMDISFKKQDLASVNIHIDDLQILDEVGKGQFGRVSKATWKGMQVAVKEIPLGYGEPDLSEVSLCSRLRHPNLVLLLGHVVTDESLLLVMNYIKGDNLAKSLGLARGRKHQVLEPKWNGYVLYNICQGMAYLSEKNIIHQDLKPANVMVEHPTNKAIICDLGVGKLMDATYKTRAGGNAGTLAYQHKEQLLGKAPSQAGDVYSFAVLMVEVYTRVPVWQGFGLAQLQKAIMDDVYPAYDSTDIPAEAKDIIRICFRSAENRPTFVVLLEQVKCLVGGDIDIW